MIQSGSVAHPSFYSMENVVSQADHSSLSRDKLKNEWHYSTTPIVYGVYKGKHCHTFFPIPAIYSSAIFVSFRAEQEWGMFSVYDQNLNWLDI